MDRTSVSVQRHRTIELVGYEIKDDRFMKFLCRFLPRDRWSDAIGREIIASPFHGVYGLAGWVLAINGSPPRLVAVVNFALHNLVVCQQEKSKSWPKFFNQRLWQQLLEHMRRNGLETDPNVPA